MSNNCPCKIHLWMFISTYHLQLHQEVNELREENSKLSEMLKKAQHSYFADVIQVCLSTFSMSYILF